MIEVKEKTIFDVATTDLNSVNKMLEKVKERDNLMRERKRQKSTVCSAISIVFKTSFSCLLVAFERRKFINSNAVSFFIAKTCFEDRFKNV